jgi:hypothetical protein
VLIIFSDGNHQTQIGIDHPVLELQKRFFKLFAPKGNIFVIFFQGATVFKVSDLIAYLQDTFPDSLLFGNR